MTLLMVYGNVIINITRVLQLMHWNNLLFYWTHSLLLIVWVHFNQFPWKLLTCKQAYVYAWYWFMWLFDQIYKIVLRRKPTEIHFKTRNLRELKYKIVLFIQTMIVSSFYLSFLLLWCLTFWTLMFLWLSKY